MDYRRLIDEIGAQLGASKFARDKWRLRGVPWKHRIPIGEIAASRGTPIPPSAFDAPSPGTPSRAPDPAGPVGGDSGAGGALHVLTRPDEPAAPSGLPVGSGGAPAAVVVDGGGAADPSGSAAP